MSDRPEDKAELIALMRDRIEAGMMKTVSVSPKPSEETARRTLAAVEEFKAQLTKAEADAASQNALMDAYKRVWASAAWPTYYLPYNSDGSKILLSPADEANVAKMAQKVGMAPEDFKTAFRELWEAELMPAMRDLAQRIVREEVLKAYSDVRQQLKKTIQKSVDQMVKVKIQLGPDLEPVPAAGGRAYRLTTAEDDD